MTRDEMIASLEKRAAHERKVAREYEKMKAGLLGDRVAMDRWRDECLMESAFFLEVAEALGGK